MRIDLAARAKNVAWRIIEIVLNVMSQRELGARGGILGDLIFNPP
jgi:hypothetical protein